MTENKRFEMKVNQHNQCDIVDWVESKEKNAICIYNDLGDYHFSSAKALCELLNELNNEVKSQSLVIKGYQERTEKLFNENEQLKDALNQRTDQCDKYYKENEQLKIRFKEERERALKFGRDIDTLTVKNEQLKQFQDRVFSWIDMHLQRLPTLRDDEFESDNEFADPSLYSGAIQILETMKRELKGD